MSKNEKKIKTENESTAPVERPANRDVDSFLNRLRETVDGLVYISETDAPIVTVYFEFTGNISIENFVKNESADDTIEVRDPDAFFARLTTRQDWFREPERRRAKRFEELERFLETNLKDLKVYRVGKIRIDIYVLGTLDERNLCGIKTFAVET